MKAKILKLNRSKLNPRVKLTTIKPSQNQA